MSLRLLLLSWLGWMTLSVAACWSQELKFREVGKVRRVSAEFSAGAAATDTTDAPVGTSLSPPGGISRNPGSITQVTKGTGYLPNEHGQKWREYDITPYTSRVTTTERPEQAILDWILRETGTEAWFSEPVGLLTANRERLIAYHTPDIQQVVGEIVDRFVSSQAESHVFGLQLVTIASPNWRSRALPLMRSVTVQSPGVDAWLLSKENAAILIGQLRKRSDFRAHNSPNLLIQNGQAQTLARTRPRNYARSLRLRDGAFPGYEIEMGQIQEGYSLQISPLLSMDNSMVDAVMKCHIDQVEKLLPVSVDIPGGLTQRQTAQIQVPQLVSWRLHERFRWPTDRVLLLSCGVIATPSNDRPATAFGLPKFLSNPNRADALLFIESKGRASQTQIDPQSTAERGSPNSRGRY